MKNTSIAAALIALGFASAYAEPAVETETTTTKSVTETEDGTVTETTTTTTTFTPEVETKIMEFFKTYEKEPNGLPPAVVKTVKVEELPEAWTTATVEPGLVIVEDQRDLLIEAPEPVVTMLPTERQNTSYYIAGSNLIAVDQDYKVVESVRIPTITFKTEG